MIFWFLSFLLPCLVNSNAVTTCKLFKISLYNNEKLIFFYFQANSAAAARAVAYLWSQVDKNTFLWPEGEIGQGVLGVAGYNPPSEGGRFKNLTEQLIMTVNIEALGSEFLAKTLT